MTLYIYIYIYINDNSIIGEREFEPLKYLLEILEYTNYTMRLLT